MANEEFSGAAQGAAAGFAAGGPVGAVIGGIVGFVSGVFASKANKQKKKAKKEQIRAQEREAAIQRRDLIRNIRISRASAVAAAASESGGLQSSAPLGAVSSIESQGSAAISYFDTQVASGRAINAYLDKAAKYEGLSTAVGAFAGFAGELGSGIYKKIKTPPKTNGNKGTSFRESMGANSPLPPGTVS